MIRNEDICAEVQNGLPLFVGGDLEPALAADIARHLEHCSACNEEERAARSARTLLVSALELSERRGPDLWSNVRAVLSEDGLIRDQSLRDGASQSFRDGASQALRDGASQAPRDGASLSPREVAASTSAVSASGASLARRSVDNSRSVRRYIPYAAAAAAALIVGLWFGRAALHTPNTGTPDTGTQPENMVTVPPNEGPAVPIGALPNSTGPIVPVSETGGLRPLRRGEAPLHVGAHSYFDSPWIDGWANNGPTQATTVDKRQARWQ